MQTTRTHNFSLFVTVLSACLGLLAVGTPAQVYAQQAAKVAQSPAPAPEAMKCGGEVSFEVGSLFARGAFFRPVQQFIADLKKLISIDKIKADYQHADIEVEVSQDNKQALTSTNLDRWLRIVAEDAAAKLAADFGDDVAFCHYNNEWKQDVAHFDIVFHLDDSGLSIITAHEQKSLEQAQKLATAYNAYFFLGACQSENEFGKLFYENTKALADTDKILIITRLPRAGLDKLLLEQPEAN